MLEAATCGPITRLHLGRTVFGRRLYTVNAYLVDGLLIDTGCPATAAAADAASNMATRAAGHSPDVPKAAGFYSPFV